MRLWRLRSRLVLTIVGVLVAFAAVMSLSLAFALSGTGSVSSQTCNTTLAQAVGAGSDVITVADMADCDPLDWIVINQGGATEECQQIESVAAGAPMLYLYGTLDNAHGAGEDVIEVGECPTPTPEAPETPTPTPTPTPPPAEFICTPPPTSRTFDLQVGWNNLVWTGASGADPATVLSCIEGNYAIAYRFVALGQTFERYVPGDDLLSNMTNLNQYDSLLVLVTAADVQCQDMPVTP